MDFGQKALERRGFAGVAQLVEQLICNQQVEGSSPPAGSRAGESGGSSFFLLLWQWGDTKAVNWGRL